MLNRVLVPTAADCLRGCTIGVLFNDAIFTVNTDDTGFTKITQTGTGQYFLEVRSPRFNADGTPVYYLSNEGINGAISYFAMSVLGSFRSTYRWGNVYEVYDFSPDGSKITYSISSNNAEPDGDVFVMNANGSNKVNITIVRVWMPLGFSPDGSRITLAPTAAHFKYLRRFCYECRWQQT